MPQFFGDIETEGNIDFFEVDLVAGRTYYFELEGSPTGAGTLPDSYLNLYDPSGNFLTADDDGGVGLNARLVYTATQTGVYFIGAAAFDDLYTGTYRLRAFEDDYRNTQEGVGGSGLVTTGGNRTGTLNYTGDADMFRTTLIDGLNYTIEERGSATGDGSLTDPYLYLQDEFGGAITEDDDSGTGLNSLINYQADRTGTYFLQARSFFDSGTDGYRIFVSEGRGSNVADIIVGSADADAINGLGGNDSIRGLGGTDLLKGGTGADGLTGGTGRDTFRFLSASESAGASRDTIRSGDGASAFEGAGSAAGDRIDLAGIDANTASSGNQAFLFGGSGRQHLTLVNSGSNTLVRGNIDSDAAFEFELIIADGSVSAGSYTAADFVL